MKIKIYKDDSGEYRWRMVARNGEIVADSSEGYKRLSSCKRTIASIQKAKVTVVDQSTLFTQFT